MGLRVSTLRPVGPAYRRRALKSPSKLGISDGAKAAPGQSVSRISHPVDAEELDHEIGSTLSHLNPEVREHIEALAHSGHA